MTHQYNLLKLTCDQCLCLVNTSQMYEAWLASGRDSLALSLRRYASRNRRVGLGTMPPQMAHELRQVAEAQPEAVITSYHALYAYAMLAASQLVQLDVTLPVTTVTCLAAYPVVCVDQAGFSVMVRVPDPVEYLAYADGVGARVVEAMLNDGLLPLDFSQLRQ